MQNATICKSHKATFCSLCIIMLSFTELKKSLIILTGFYPEWKLLAMMINSMKILCRVIF